MNYRALLVWAIVSSPLLAETSFNRASALETAGVTYSYSSKEDLNHAGPAGAVAVSRIELSASGRTTLSPADGVSFGFAYSLTDLDRDPGTLLPNRLSECALLASWTHHFSPQISASITARPGLYGDFDDIDDKTLNAPVLFTTTYAQRPDLVWLFGLNLNLKSDIPVLPIVGVRWQIAPDLTFSAGFPQSGFVWRWTDAFSLRAGIGFQGGTYRINDSAVLASISSRRLTHTYLDYREIRIGVGATIKLSDKVSITVDAGSMLDRRFDYYDRDYALDGSSGLFGALALRFTP